VESLVAPVRSGLLQRKCASSDRASRGGECEEYGRERGATPSVGTRFPERSTSLGV